MMGVFLFVTEFQMPQSALDGTVTGEQRELSARELSHRQRDRICFEIDSQLYFKSAFGRAGRMTRQLSMYKGRLPGMTFGKFFSLGVTCSHSGI